MMSHAKIRAVLGTFIKLARLSTFLACVGAVCTLLAARSVYGSATRSLVELNQEWAKQVGKLGRDEYRVRLNGQSMMVSSRMTDQSVQEVLGAAEEECRAHSGNLAEDVAKLPKSVFVQVPVLLAAKGTSYVFGTIRKEWDTHGYVACFERDGDPSNAALLSKLELALATGDISKIGTFRYVSADHDTKATRTHVLRQWTEGEFNLRSAFPKTGDVPGSDLPEVARPEGGRLILDADVEGTPVGVRIYEAPGKPAEVLATYDSQLAAKGWTGVDVPEKNAQTMRVYDQGPADLFITASKNPNGRGSVVSIGSSTAR